LQIEDIGQNSGSMRATGQIIVQLWTEEMARAATTALVSAHDAIRTSRTSTAATSLSAVVSKLQLFVGIADEAAKVFRMTLDFGQQVNSSLIQIHPYVNFVWQATSSIYKVQSAESNILKIANTWPA
jgi:hypothetical protein